MTDLYTVRQVQQILKVDRITIYRMLNDGRLKGIKIGQQWRFPHTEIDRMLGISEPVVEQAAEPELGMIDNSFPTHCIQTIQNLFADISRIGAVVVDMNGENLTTFSHPNAFCSLLMTSPSGRSACQACWKDAAEKSTATSAVTCHAGLQYLAAPIYDRGNQIGALIAGQYYWQQPDRYEETERVQQLARTHHIDQQKLMNSALEIQVVQAEKHAQVENWPKSTVEAMHSILNERSGFLDRLKQIANLTQLI
jgi:excisionase family DNA binding protein